MVAPAKDVVRRIVFSDYVRCWYDHEGVGLVTRMRIALVTETWVPAVDGVVTRLRVTMAELVRRGHAVLLIAPYGNGVGEYPPGVQIVEAPSLGWSFVSDGRRFGVPMRGPVRKALEEFRPDVVHVLSPYILCRPAITAARKLSIPVVGSFHYHLPAAARHAGLGVLSRPLWAYLRHQHGHADHTLATSNAMVEVMRELGVGPVSMWPFGVDLQRFTPARRTPQARRRLIGSRETTVALYVGRLAPEKRVERLVPLAKDPRVTLVVVGDGQLRPALEKELESTGTVFTGWLSGDELADAYAAADVFTFPSDSETLGFVLIEAMASGLPIVAARNAPTAEILGDSGAGVMIDPDQWRDAATVVAGLGHGAVREKAGAAARSRAQDWDWSAATDSLLATYCSVLRPRTELLAAS